MNILATIGLIAGFFLLLFQRPILDWHRARDSRKNTRKVKAAFQRNWNGTEDDIIPAWERTVNSMAAFGYPEEQLTEAQLHLFYEIQKGANPPMHLVNKSRTIRSGGRFIDVTEIQN